MASFTAFTWRCSWSSCFGLQQEVERDRRQVQVRRLAPQDLRDARLLLRSRAGAAVELHLVHDEVLAHDPGEVVHILCVERVRDRAVLAAPRRALLLARCAQSSVELLGHGQVDVVDAVVRIELAVAVERMAVPAPAVRMFALRVFRGGLEHPELRIPLRHHEEGRAQAVAGSREDAGHLAGPLEVEGHGGVGGDRLIERDAQHGLVVGIVLGRLECASAAKLRPLGPAERRELDAARPRRIESMSPVRCAGLLHECRSLVLERVEVEVQPDLLDGHGRWVGPGEPALAPDLARLGIQRRVDLVRELPRALRRGIRAKDVVEPAGQRLCNQHERQPQDQQRTTAHPYASSIFAL